MNPRTTAFAAFVALSVLSAWAPSARAQDGSEVALALAVNATVEAAARCGCDYVIDDDSGDDSTDDSDDDGFLGGLPGDDGATGGGALEPGDGGASPGPLRPGRLVSGKAASTMETCLTKQFAAVKRAIKLSNKGLRVLLGDAKSELAGDFDDESDYAMDYCLDDGSDDFGDDE